MPRDKDRKRIIRERMKKTGESYTAARAHLLSKHTANRPAAPVRDLGALTGMTDAAVAAKTGRTWRSGSHALDADGAASMTAPRHRRDGARHTSHRRLVGTDRHRRLRADQGLRERGQRRNGTYEATKSRTYNVPVAALFEARAEPTARRRWLDGVDPVVRNGDGRRSRYGCGGPMVRASPLGSSAKGRGKAGRGRAQKASRPDRIRQSEGVLGRTARCARCVIREQADR